MENTKKNNGNGNGNTPMPVGRWTIDIDNCVGCGECVDSCTRSLLKIQNRKVQMTDEINCNQCGDCERACAYYAIDLT